MAMSLYVGTSGYSYKEWKGKFYPEKLPATEMLRYYSEHFHAVELNNTFYRTPQPSMVESWKSQVPENFRFSVKASQGITHFRRLANASDATRRMLEAISGLENRLGVVIFRLPSDMKKDLPRLKAFLKQLPPDTPVAFDFRHPTWFDEDVFTLLRNENRALVVSDTEDLPTVYKEKTADWGYLRLRRMKYSESELKKWIKWMRAQQWKDAYVFFRHEDEGTGPKLATQFLKLVSTDYTD